MALDVIRDIFRNVEIYIHIHVFEFVDGKFNVKVVAITDR